MNDPRSHHECWNTIAREMETTRAKRFAGKSYDYYPRGRCPYSRQMSRFLLYVDPCISKTQSTLGKLLYEFGLPREMTMFITNARLAALTIWLIARGQVRLLRSGEQIVAKSLWKSLFHQDAQRTLSVPEILKSNTDNPFWRPLP